MFAINHAATALLVKKAFPGVPMAWILISVQFMEIIWVILNFAGIERTTTRDKVSYVGDIALVHMPYSHSVATMTGTALLSWLIIGRGFGHPEVGLAFAIGVFSHLILDLLTHARDISPAPLVPEPRLGLGLYARSPIPAFFLEIGYGVFCWWVYGGGWVLLGIIAGFNLANASMFFRKVPGLERWLAHRPRVITLVILVQIIVTLILVGLFSRK